MLRETQMTVSGNVTRSPELKHRKVDGRPFVVVPIAVNNRRFDAEKQGWVEDGPTYYDIICRGSLGANALASVDVGMPVVAHGRFRLHEWTTDTMRGTRPCVVADSIGVDLAWGTTAYTKGSRSFPQPDGYETTPPPASEGGPVTGTVAPPEFRDDLGPDEADGTDLDEDDIPADADGVVSEQDAQAHLARTSTAAAAA